MTIIPSIIICKLILACSMSKGETSLENGMSISTTCSEGTFYSREYLRCIPCSWCDSYSVKLSSCTATSDTVCLRCADTSNPDIANHPSCKKCPPCNPGEYISKPCTDDSITVCLPCPSESFNIQPSYKTYCIPCTSCENRIMVKDCNASMDTVCGSCKRGYYKDPNRNTCYRCSSCLPGGKVIEECKGGRPGKLCSGFHFYRVDYVEVSSKYVTENTTLAHTTSPYLNISSVPAHDISILTMSSRVLILITSACFFILIVCVTALPFCCLQRRRQKTEHLLNDQEVDEFLLETDCGDRYEHTNCQSVEETKINISSKDNYTDRTKNELMESCYNNYDVENDNAVMRDQRDLYSYAAAMTENIHVNKTHPQRNLWQNVFF